MQVLITRSLTAVFRAWLGPNVSREGKVLFFSVYSCFRQPLNNDRLEKPKKEHTRIHGMTRARSFFFAIPDGAVNTAEFQNIYIFPHFRNKCPNLLVPQRTGMEAVAAKAWLINKDDSDIATVRESC